MRLVAVAAARARLVHVLRLHRHERAVVLEADAHGEVGLGHRRVERLAPRLHVANGRAAQALGQHRRELRAALLHEVAIAGRHVGRQRAVLVGVRAGAHERRHDGAVRGEVRVVRHVAHLLAVGVAPRVVRPVGEVRRRHGAELAPHGAAVVDDLDVVGLLEPVLHAALLPLHSGAERVAGHVGVGVHLGAQDGRAGLGRLARVEDERQHLPLHLDGGKGLLAHLLVHGHHDGAHLVALELGLVAQKRAAAELEVRRTVLRHAGQLLVLVGEHELDALDLLGFGDVEALDLRVAVGAPQRHRGQRTLHPQVGGVLGRARHHVPRLATRMVPRAHHLEVGAVLVGAFGLPHARLAHQLPPSIAAAASWIACTWREYVPQRQMLPASSARICSSVGAPYFSMMYFATVNWPGVQ